MKRQTTRDHYFQIYKASVISNMCTNYAQHYADTKVITNAKLIKAWGQLKLFKTGKINKSAKIHQTLIILKHLYLFSQNVNYRYFSIYDATCFN